jgi:hypothetical protein
MKKWQSAKEELEEEVSRRCLKDAAGMPPLQVIRRQDRGKMIAR